MLLICKKYKKVDIVYMDPPYNKRQYASNFHVLENIVVYDKQKLNGKTGLRDYSSQKSDYCIKNKVKKSFQELVDNIDAKYIIMSYSTEGLLSVDDILDILSKKVKLTFIDMTIEDLKQMHGLMVIQIFRNYYLFVRFVEIIKK